MSFLDKNNSEYLSARITQKGRNAIAKGSFNIKYFIIGDSEFDYSNPFSGITGNVLSGATQAVFSPMDKDINVKYPINYSDNIVYGIPITGSTVEVIRNVVEPAGFVSNYSSTGTTIQCISNTLPFSSLNGSSTITVTKLTGTTYAASEFISLSLKPFQVNGNDTIITGTTTAYQYKLLSVSGATSGTTQILTLDRNTPDLSALSGTANVTGNKCDDAGSWMLDVVWGKKPMGLDVGGMDQNLSGFTGNKYISTKELLGYTSTGQTFINLTGGTVTGTTYANTYNELKELIPNEQKCIAVIHYSEVGDIVNNPDRFYTYDDYISYKTGITGSDISIVDDELGNPLSDKEYFEIYLPFLQYHRNTGSTVGARFIMGDETYYVKSVVNESATFKYRYLMDEWDNNVGKIFVDKKTIVIDDEEIVASLDYKSNRTYTLPAPKVGNLATDTSAITSLLTETDTVWISYGFAYDDDSMNSLPCNYYVKVDGTSTPSNVTVKFDNSFPFMKNSLNNLKDGFIANKFIIFVQKVELGELPNSQNWYAIDFTEDCGGDGYGLLDSSNITGKTFTITNTKYENGTLFDLNDHISDIYDGTKGNFGGEQPFPGSIRLVRASDIEEMKFLINLPAGKFTQSQNPSKSQNLSMNPMITEIGLLDEQKNLLVFAKTSKPIQRIGSQVFSVRLDF